jgi:hypothetical protein
MFLRLRRLCLVARELQPLVDDLCAVLGLQVCHRDCEVARFGLHNALMRICSGFIEVGAPLHEGTPAGRYLQRRGGDGGYMVTLDYEDIEPCSPSSQDALPAGRDAGPRHLAPTEQSPPLPIGPERTPQQRTCITSGNLYRDACHAEARAAGNKFAMRVNNRRNSPAVRSPKPGSLLPSNASAISVQSSFLRCRLAIGSIVRSSELMCRHSASARVRTRLPSATAAAGLPEAASFKHPMASPTSACSAHAPLQWRPAAARNPVRADAASDASSVPPWDDEAAAETPACKPT